MNEVLLLLLWSTMKNSANVLNNMDLHGKSGRIGHMF